VGITDNGHEDLVAIRSGSSMLGRCGLEGGRTGVLMRPMLFCQVEYSVSLDLGRSIPNSKPVDPPCVLDSRSYGTTKYPQESA
jgi:hypothetical protein